MTPAPVEQSLSGVVLFFFLTFAWERTVCIPRAKTNPDSHLICVMHDLRSVDDKLSGNVECLASMAAVILVLLVGSSLLTPVHCVQNASKAFILL